LQQDLYTLRTLLNQYFVDTHKRPHSLDELVTAGYLKQIPTDPMTGRNDSLNVEWSNDPKIPGITNVRSSSDSMSSKGTAYRDW
jgi:general secretion pathway protein G